MIFVLCLLLLLAYAWLGYPLLLRGLAGRRPDHVAPALTEPPPVAVLIAAHNEERHIRQRLENILALDYPRDRITILLGLDGCTDRTAAMAREFAAGHPNVHVHEGHERRGKVAVLKDLVAVSTASILVFTDANTEFQPDAVAKLAAHLADPSVGGVCGRLLFRNSREDAQNTQKDSESAYWDLESSMKQWESRLDSCLGANGAIYAVRRKLFWSEIPDNAIIDDFVVGMKVREQGVRMIFEPGAVAEEDLPDPAHEWTRRVRIGAGAYQALGWCRRCLLPRYGVFAWCFLSHKVLRWLTPHMLLLAAVLLAWQLRHDPVLIVVFAFAAAALALRPLRYLALMQAALLIGFYRFCRGNLQGAWTRTPR